ncbi:putative thioredoxin-like protein [Rosa chinensis]|uniref:Putative thioredoxin-like protein n=1 Tax=Rosa chinensis TaxID=74649 RepID=A0A2P6QBE4_ROSCH|nr:uncharacterized protein LOC112164641 [Rosa chinensis]PRQ31494.1 putative thioredoxin-like protein [Rosa chinensis]
MGRRLFACFGKGLSSSPSSSATHEKHTSAATADVSAEEQRKSGPVLVELFSSQGCTTSPVAELLLSRLGRGDFNGSDVPPVVVLAYHVDYWDYMGWKDPYGSSQWTVRQKAYIEALKQDTMFTPQVVVQGTAQCVGNDENDLLTSIKQATRYAAPTFQATFERPSPDSLQVSLTGALRTKVDSNGANVMVALYESGLVTDCPSGENKGRVLSNDYVVRRLEKLCTVKDVPAKKTISGTITFPLWQSFNATKCGMVVFIQNSSHQIFGSQKFQLPDN